MTMGGVALGAAITGLITPRAPSNDILNQLIKDKPEFYKFIDIDLSTARTDQVYDEPGTFIWVDNQFARGEVTLRLNELQFGKFDLRRQKYIEGPFYRFFITNVTGQGSIRLFISRGYRAASEPIEAINRAELAARLGSQVTYDRRGDVIWLEDFENGIQKWHVQAGTVTWSAAQARYGGFSAKLVTGAALGNQAEILVSLPSPVLGKIGGEVAFTLTDRLDYVSLIVTYRDGLLAHEAFCLLNVTSEEIRCVDDAGNEIKLADSGVLRYDNESFYIMKLVFDIATQEYVRIIFNNMELPATGIAYQATGDPSAPVLDVSINIENNAAFAATSYVDCVIVTQNEP